MRLSWQSLFFVAALAVAPTSWAQWELKSEGGVLNFASVKVPKGAQAAVIELHHFKEMQGSISTTGELRLSLAASGLDTGIEVRDDRMRTTLLQAEKFPAVEFIAQLDLAKLSQLQPGQYQDLELKGKLMIAGKTDEISAAIRYVQLEQKQALVSNLDPIIIDLAQFSLLEKVEALRAVAGLELIATTVPVNFSLILSQP